MKYFLTFLLTSTVLFSSDFYFEYDKKIKNVLSAHPKY